VQVTSNAHGIALLQCASQLGHGKGMLGDLTFSVHVRRCETYGWTYDHHVQATSRSNLFNLFSTASANRGAGSEKEGNVTSQLRSDLL
jgi:hypothetical protein